MKLVPIHSYKYPGHFAIVDDEDYERVSQHHWYRDPSNNKPPIIYASRFVGKGKPNESMHRFILGLTDPNIHVDHKDHIGLNNQKSNLRPCTRSQNAGNSRPLKKKRYKYKGASKSGTIAMPWRAHFRGKHLGCFLTEEDAARAYDKASLEFFGEFALLNFPK